MINFLKLFQSAKQLRSHLSHYETVRWKKRPRKPFWLGIARTKMFIIPVKEEDPPEEKAELERLKVLYDRHMESLHKFIMKDREIGMAADRLVAEKKEEDFRSIFEQSVLLNNEWNAECAKMREERLKSEDMEREKSIKEFLEKTEEENRIRNQEIENLVRAEIAAADTLITESNLDEAVDQCMNSIVDYNYAIDRKGNVYRGSELFKHLLPEAQDRKLEQQLGGNE